MDHINVASIGGASDLKCFDSFSVHVMELGRVALRNRDRARFQKQYCLEVKIHETSSKGCRTVLAMLWNLANIVDIMEDNLDVTVAVLLDNTMALLYVGWCSAGEGLTEDARACIDHFSPYMEWRGMAVEFDFKALTLTEGQDLIRAYKTRSQKTLRGRGRPRVLKPLAP